MIAQVELSIMYASIHLFELCNNLNGSLIKMGEFDDDDKNYFNNNNIQKQKKKIILTEAVRTAITTARTAKTTTTKATKEPHNSIHTNIFSRLQ